MPFQPLTQEQYQKARDSGFSHDDIIGFEKKRKSSGLSAGEKAIAERKSYVKDLRDNPPKSIKDIGVMRGLSAVSEVAEGIPANIGLALQRGTPQDIPKDIGALMQGNRPAQRGDIFREIGVPEGAAATLGLMSGGTMNPSSAIGKTFGNIGKLTSPDAALFSSAGKAISRIAQVKTIADKVGKPVVAKFLSVLSRVPENSVTEALDNPKYLSRGWVNKELSIVKSLYKKTIDPLINNSKNRVDTKSLSNIAQETGLLTSDGAWSKSFSTMNGLEKRKILAWEKQLSSGDLSFNEVDSILGQIDDSLARVYKAGREGKAFDFSDDFMRTARKFRTLIGNTRDAQYPEAAKVIKRYGAAKTADTVNKNFDKWLPSLMPALTVGAGVGIFGVKDPAIYGAATLGAIPKIQSYGIRGVDIGMRNIARSGSMIPNAIVNQER